jgi:hypothetical protein
MQNHLRSQLLKRPVVLPLTIQKIILNPDQRLFFSHIIAQEF